MNTYIIQTKDGDLRIKAKDTNALLGILQDMAHEGQITRETFNEDPIDITEYAGSIGLYNLFG